MALARECSDEIHSLDCPVQIITARTDQGTSTETNHSHFLFIPNLGRKILKQIFPKDVDAFRKHYK